MKKNFNIPGAQIQLLVPSLGYALASDKICIEGRPVDYMVRGEPSEEGDSGWVFYGGGETQEYIDDPNNLSLLSVNTVANYDPEIIGFLTYPSGTEVERNGEGRLEVTTPNAKEPDVVFLYPVVAGRNSLTKTWSVELTVPMLRRYDHGSLVIWRPGFTAWITTFNANSVCLEDRVNNTIATMSENAEGFERVEVGALVKLRYWLKESTNGGTQRACYISGFVNDEQIQLALYFDTSELMQEVTKIWSSLAWGSDT